MTYLNYFWVNKQTNKTLQNQPIKQTNKTTKKPTLWCLDLLPSADKEVSRIHSSGGRKAVIEVQVWSTGSWEGAGNPAEDSVQVLNHGGDVAQDRISGTDQSSYSWYSKSLVSD